MPINTDLIGYETKKVETLVLEEKVIEYLSAINSTNNYYSLNNVAPPIFNVVQEISLLESIWKMPELYGSKEEMEQSVLMLVHGEQNMVFNKLLSFNIKVFSQAKIDSIVQKGSNYILKLSVTHLDDNNNQLGSSTWTLFIRATESDIVKTEKPKNIQKKQLSQTVERIPINSKSFKIGDDITHKYSKASNDFNPIHIDEKTAKKAGLSGIIVHGLCTMAMTMEKLISMNISDDPSKLKSISLRFSSPVYPGDKLTVKTFDTDEKNKFNFEVENQSNVKVIKNGSFGVID